MEGGKVLFGVYIDVAVDKLPNLGDVAMYDVRRLDGVRGRKLVQGARRKSK